jgi:glycosyltransferase involved in cell wall biosynthesis
MAGRGLTEAKPLKVLVAAHSHPRVSKGGAEIASYQLFEDLRSRPEYRVWFLGCSREARFEKPGATFSQPFGPDEYLYAAAGFDWFRFANLDPRFPETFRDLLRELDPDVVHFNHYAVFGVEALLHVRRTLPRARIVLTLHEYLAVCNHYGQMVTKPDRALCHKASPEGCTQCFPELATADFHLRERYIKRFFSLVDQFISPSRFLAERYIAWGVPAEKMSVIENLVPAARPPNRERAARRPGPLRVGYFGQISGLKGIDVLLDAAEVLEEAEETAVTIEIFGEYRGQPPEFQAHFLERIGKIGRNVTIRGAYDSERVDDLMRGVDAIVIPSVWWENSPVVIEEALRNRRPILCSDIGGMAEKVRDGLDGFHFPAGDVMALASLLTDLAANRDMLASLDATLRPAANPIDVAARHRAVYEAAAASPTRLASAGRRGRAR